MDELYDLDTLIDEDLPTTENEEPEGEDPEGTEGGKPKKDDDQTGENGEVKPEKGGKKEGDETDESKEDDEKTEKTEPEKKPKKDRVQKRIDEITRERYRLQRENEELRSKLESREPELPPAPDPKDYTYDPNKKGDMERARDQFNRDLGKYEAAVESIKQSHQNRDVDKIQREQRQYFTKMSSEKSIFGDYDSAVKGLSNVRMTPELHDALKNEENRTDLFCWLGKHPDVAESVLNMPGYSQSRELAKIAMKLRAAVERKKQKTSKAPTPPAKTPKGGVSAKKDPAKMTPEEWAKDQGYKT